MEEEKETGEKKLSDPWSILDRIRMEFCRFRIFRRLVKVKISRMREIMYLIIRITIVHCYFGMVNRRIIDL